METLTTAEALRLVALTSYKPEGAEYVGQIVDSDNGRTYTITITARGTARLSVRGGETYEFEFK